ncbi:MAG: PAS domain S-box protein [Ruminococcaceae bacterium]|nr:PAS domain S-box protein [Oscillospiraceae bacterium]
MTKRIFRSIFFVAMVILLASLLLILGFLYGYFASLQKQHLQTQTLLAAQGVTHEGMAYFQNLETDSARLTWIAPDGRVLFDSISDAESMENHAERAEVRAAIRDGYGESTRRSQTVGEQQMYAAKRLPDGSILRLSVRQYTVFTFLPGLTQPIAIVIALAVCLSLILAANVAKQIVRPLNELDPDKPTINNEYEELNPLLRRLSRQQAQLRAQTAELRRRQDEFNAATDRMNEGLVLVGEEGVILSINRAAAAILGTSRYLPGQDIRSLDPAFPMEELLLRAKNGEPAEQHLERNGLDYQLNVSPILSEGRFAGFVLLIFNITDRMKNEQLRREFTANVSHELKTPLHSISGCAELLCSGLVKPEDAGQFAGQIHAEAKRMVRLIDDIIKLSRLDEGISGSQRTELDLSDIAESAVSSLQTEAASAGVTLSLNTSPAPLIGIPQLLYGIVFNLCDNAVKYNREGGRVEVSVEEDTQKNAVRLIVRDTGIGIPEEHIGRIFERFYRVDKSHSKEVGGTGLGLSIVKHAARLHNAHIDVDSTIGQGTAITVTFPRS